MINSILPITAPTAIGSATKPPGYGFSQMFQDAVARAEDLQAEANHRVESLLRGDDQDLHNVALAVQKAELQFEFVQQVRNKVVQAYQEVMRSGI